MYADRDIYIFDDCLSALDAHVGKTIMENVITGLLSNKTRILVTHALQYADRTDWIVAMEQMSIFEQGHYSTLVKRNELFASMMKNIVQEEENVKDKQAEGVHSGTLFYLIIARFQYSYELGRAR